MKVEAGIIAYRHSVANYVDKMKVVISAQLKSTVGKVYAEDETPKTEDGKEIDIEFGSKSVGARMVESCYVMGTTASLLIEIGKRAARIYNGQ